LKCSFSIHAISSFIDKPISLDFEYGWNSRQRQGTEEGYQLVRIWEVAYYASLDEMSHD